MKKIERRDLLKIGGGTIVGSMAGYVFSGAPFQGLQWLAEWTQDEHIPPKGEEKYLQGICDLCPNTCTMSIRKIAHRAVKVETSNSGCPIGQNALQLLYHPERITKPLKLKGKKGSGKYIEVSWEEALKDISAKMKSLTATNKADSIAAINREANVASDLLDLMVFTAGSQNIYYEPTLESLTSAALNGSVQYDLANVDYALSFGARLFEGWGLPAQMNSVLKTWTQSGTRHVQVDSVNTRTASLAKEWVPVKPGTEAVLAFGIANYLISEKNRTANVAEFGKWSSVIINQYPLPVVAKITGVSENKIKEIAEGLLAATNPVAIGGRGAQGISSSSTELIAVQLLNLLINSRAVTLKLRSGLGNVTLNERKSAGLDDFIRSGNFEMLFVNGANPVHKSVNGAVLAEKMKGAFVVSFSQLKTDTAVYSDYILPTLSFFEVAGAEGEAIVSGITDGKHAGDAIIAIAQMVDKTKDAFTWKSFTECVPLTGNALPAGEFSIKPEETLKKYIADSTKASDDAVKYPLGLIPIEIPCVGDGDGMAFPYTLKILDRYTFSNGKLWVLMNRKTADREGISEGEKIDIESKRGEIGSVKVHLTDTVAPDVIAIPLGFGHDAYTNYAEGKGVNPKAIMNDTIDPLSGAADWWMTMVKIS